MGGAGDTRMCRRFCIGGEKSRLTPPNFYYTPKVFTVRLLHLGLLRFSKEPLIRTIAVNGHHCQVQLNSAG